MDFDIFKDESEKTDARQRLAELQEHQGWKYLCRVLDKNIEVLQDELDTKRNHENKEDVYLSIEQQLYLRKLKELPKLLLEDLKPELPEEEDDED